MKNWSFIVMNPDIDYDLNVCFGGNMMDLKHCTPNNLTLTWPMLRFTNMYTLRNEVTSYGWM